MKWDVKISGVLTLCLMKINYVNVRLYALKSESGASSWAASRKKAFANDRSNHVPSCGRVNSSKGSEGPSDFLRRSRDGRGLEYKIVRFCEYVQKYHAVKVKYGLSFKSNKAKLFKSCGINPCDFIRSSKIFKLPITTGPHRLFCEGLL